MIPTGISRGPKGRINVPVWLVAAGAVVGVVVLFLLYVLFTMGSEPVVEVIAEDITVSG